MKKSISLVAIILAIVATQAFSQERIATFFAQDGEKFWVIMDGIRQNDKPSANVKVSGLTNSNYRVKIIFEDESVNNVDQNIMTEGFVDESMESKPADVTWVLKRDRKGRMAMRGSSFKPANSTAAAEPRQESVKFHLEETAPAKEEKQTTTTITPPANTQVNTTTTTTKSNPGNKEKVDINISVDGLNTNISMTATDMDMTVEENVEVTTTTTTTTQKQPTQKPAPTPAVQPASQPVAQGCSKAMTTADFQKAKNSISSQSFSETRMKVARQAVKGCVNTTQVRELIDLFSFEGDKLTFAKYVYDFTTDKNNFYTLTDVFSFSSSAEDLSEFLEGK